jgi:hypothetical protein
MTDSTIRRQEWYDTNGNPVARVDSPGPPDAIVLMQPVHIVRPDEARRVVAELEADPNATPTFRPPKLRKGASLNWINLPGDENRIYQLQVRAPRRTRRATQTAAPYRTTDQLMTDSAAVERPED